MSSYEQTSNPPLDWPHYGIGFIPAIKRVYQKYATFSGRASRSEYWWFYLAFTIVSTVLGALVGGLGVVTSDDGGETPGPGAIAPGIVLGLIFLASIVPIIAVGVRRLHDAGYSGLMYLLCLIPYLGGLVLIIFMAMPTSPKAVQYGPPAPEGYQPGPYGFDPAQAGYGYQQPNPYAQQQYPPAPYASQQPGYPPQQPGFPQQPGYPQQPPNQQY